MSDGILGNGTVLTVSDGTNTTTIGNVLNIGGPDQTRDVIDITTMDSANLRREFIPGLIDPGEITFDVNYDGTAAGTANDLHNLQTATAMTWKITFNDSTVETSKSSFSNTGFMTNLGFQIPFDDKVTQSVTVKMTGTPTYEDQS